MTSDDDFIGQLEAYLERFDGATPLPDRVRDAVHADLPWTRQVRPRSGLLRRINMSSTTSMIARWGLLAACLVVAVALGSAILLPGRGAGPGAATSPSPMPTVVLTPSPGASPLALAGAPAAACSSAQPSVETCIRAGTYLLAPTVPRGLVDVPVGWFEWEPGPGSVGLLVDRPDVGDGSGWGVVFMQVGDVARDPCDPSAGTYAATAVDTPAKLAGVMSAWPGFDGTPPETISIGGLTGIRTRLTSTNGTSTCPGAWIWRTSAGVTVDGYPMIVGGSGGGEGYPADFRLVEVDGHLVAIRTMASASTSPNERAQGIADDPKRHEADLVTLQGILDSIRFEGAGS
jgi:hypothetical protein